MYLYCIDFTFKEIIDWRIFILKEPTVKNEIVKNERPRDILQTCSFEEEKDPTDVTSPKSSDPELQYKTMVFQVQKNSWF